MFIKSLLKKIKNEQGIFITMTAVMIPIIFGCAGLAYDVGNLYVNKGRLQNIADSAAYAGAEVYRDIATGKLTGSVTVDNKDNDVSDTAYTPYDTSASAESPSNFATSNHTSADQEAWHYIKQNYKNRTISLNGPFALNGNISVATSEGASEINGVYYRVRLKDEIPLHFISLVPGIGNSQEVVAESIVAFSTDTGTAAQTISKSTTEYIKAFDNLFTYNDYPEDDSLYTGTAKSSISGPTKGVKDQKNLRLYTYMLFMNHQTDAIVNYFNSNTLTNNQGIVRRVENGWGGSYWVNRNYSHVLNDVYTNYVTWQQERFANIEVEPSGDLTLNINYGLDRPYLYYNGNHNYARLNFDYEYLEAGDYVTNTRTNTKTHLNAGYYTISEERHGNSWNRYYTYTYTNVTSTTLANAFELPLYIYKETSGNSTIHVSNNSKASCYPIVFYQYDKFRDPEAADSTVTVTIDPGQIFRGIILAPDSVVTINNSGTFEGSVLAKSVVANGYGTDYKYRQKNFFQNLSQEYTTWYSNYLGLDYKDVDVLDNNGNPVTYADGTKETVKRPKYVDFVDSGKVINGEKIYVPDPNNTQWKSFLNQLQSWDNATNIWYYDAQGNKVGDSALYSTFYQSLYYNDYGVNLQEYPIGSQEWFESLNLEQKARLAYFWEYIYKSSNKIQWLWAQPATKPYTDTIPGKEAIKSFRLINSRTETNPFSSSTGSSAG